MSQVKITIMPIIEGTFGMIKKETDKHINKLFSSPSLQGMIGKLSSK